MRRTGLGLVVVLSVVAGAPARAQGPPLPPRTEAARMYLSQSLASLAEARQAAVKVVELGGLEGFDLTRYLVEVDQVARGLQRYLVPEGPKPGAAPQVPITGQYLVERLQQAAPAGRIKQPGQ